LRDDAIRSLMISTNQQSRKGRTVKQRPGPSKQNKDLEKFE
jgi:hypothetical protein